MNVAFNRIDTGTLRQARKPFTETTNDVKSKKWRRGWKAFSKGFTQMKVLLKPPHIPFVTTHVIVATQEYNFDNQSDWEPSWLLTVLAGGLSARPPRPRCQSGTLSCSTCAAAVFVSFQQSFIPPKPPILQALFEVPPADSIVSYTAVCVLAEQLHIAAVQMILWNLLRIKNPFYFGCILVQTFIFMFLNQWRWTFSCVIFLPLAASRLHSGHTERLDFCNKATFQGENSLCSAVHLCVCVFFNWCSFSLVLNAVSVT